MTDVPLRQGRLLMVAPEVQGIDLFKIAVLPHFPCSAIVLILRETNAEGH